MKLKHFAKTDIGLKRKANEDSIGELLFNKSKYGNIYIVCDGMGGHEGGKMASETAINSIIEYFSNTPSDSPTTALKEAIEFANIQIFGKAQSDSQYKGMGTTCCVLLEKNNLIYVAHVGDSRIYISSDGKFHRVTKDHSFVQGLFDNGQISEEEMESHARKNELTQALGVSTEVNVEVCSDPILAKKGDNFLICSDGLCGLIDDNKIYDIVKKGKTNSDIGNNLIDAANNAGGTDNISVIYISIDESPHAKSQFISKNNIPKDNLTKTMLLDTDQKAAILAKNNFSFFNKYKNKIFISAGVLFMILLMILIIPKIGNYDVPKIEIESKTTNKSTVLDLPLDEFETQIKIKDKSVEIFYYSFKKDTNWTKEKKDFSPLVEKVKENHVMNIDIQEFYWNDEFYNYKQYKDQESKLYEEIAENSFIFIRKSKLDKKPNSDIEFDALGIKAREREEKEKLERIKRKKRKAEKARKAKEEKKKNELDEKNKIDKANIDLKNYIKIISQCKNDIEKLSINDDEMVIFLNDAKTIYKKQESSFYDTYQGGYTKIPTELSTTLEQIPDGILELKRGFHVQYQKLKVIFEKANSDYKKAEDIQYEAAKYLNTSKENFKSSENLEGQFKIIYNENNNELKAQTENDLAAIKRASSNIQIITAKSDNIKLKFNSVNDDFEKIKELLNQSKILKELIEPVVKSFEEKKKKKNKKRN